MAAPASAAPSPLEMEGEGKDGETGEVKKWKGSSRQQGGSIR